MERDRSFRLLKARRDSALHHESGEEARGAGDAVLAVDQNLFAFVRLLPQPKQRFPHMLGRDGLYVGGLNPLVRLAGMLSCLVSPRWIVSVGTANVQDRGDLLWILADEFVRVILTAEPKVVNDVVHCPDRQAYLSSDLSVSRPFRCRLRQ